MLVQAPILSARLGFVWSSVANRLVGCGRTDEVCAFEGLRGPASVHAMPCCCCMQANTLCQ